MPAKIDRETRRQIVCLRALDYTKQEIAAEVGVSRNTVRRHLQEVRDEIESAENINAALAEFLLTPEEIALYAVDKEPEIFEQAVEREVLSSLNDLGFSLKKEE